MSHYTDEYVEELHRQIEEMRPVVRRLEGERDGLRREAAELQVTYSALVGDLDIDLGKARELLGFAAWMGGKRFPIGVTPCGSCGKLAAECDKFDGLDERYRCLGIRSRAFLASTPTGTRAIAGAACVRCLVCKSCAAACDCTGGPSVETECTCYELTGGHQPGCAFNRPAAPRCVAPLGDDDTIGPREPGYCDVYEGAEGGRCRRVCAVSGAAAAENPKAEAIAVPPVTGEGPRHVQTVTNPHVGGVPTRYYSRDCSCGWDGLPRDTLAEALNDSCPRAIPETPGSGTPPTEEGPT